MARTSRFIGVLLLLLILSACENKPSEDEMEAQLQNSVRGFAEIKDLKKINARSEGEDYIADLSYTLEFKKGIKELYQELEEKGGLMAGMAIMALKMQFGEWEAGESRQLQNTFTFAKTEQGWRIIE